MDTWKKLVIDLLTSQLANNLGTLSGDVTRYLEHVTVFKSAGGSGGEYTV